MSTQLYLANHIVEGRAWSREDQVVQRDAELERAEARRARRGGRRRAGR